MNVLTTSELELLELKLILELKRNDIDCTEYESAILKSFLKEYIHINTVEAMTLCDNIQELFPIE